MEGPTLNQGRNFRIGPIEFARDVSGVNAWTFLYTNFMIMPIVAFLSIQDPRSRPVEQPEVADERHAQFADERSDFIGVLNLWRASREQAAASTRALRHWCKLNFLSYLRMREWSDLHDQLDDMTAAQQLSKRAEPAGTLVLSQTEDGTLVLTTESKEN
jgi:HrpA-like RNA helicase